MNVMNTNINIRVTMEDYLKLKTKYPTGKYYTTESGVKWFSLVVVNQFDGLTHGSGLELTFTVKPDA